MRQGFLISRRKVVTLVAGSLAATAGSGIRRVNGPASTAIGAPTADAFAVLAQSQRRMLDLLHKVRRAHGAGTRAEAFHRFTTALHTHEVAEISVSMSAPSASTTARTALYRQRDPDAVLAKVIVRELEASPQTDGAWMTRFADLEAVIHAQARKRQQSPAGEPAATA